MVDYDAHFEKSRTPQRRYRVEKVERGTIRDRFNLPLAINTIQYCAAICYGDIRSIPTVQWIKDSRGKRKKVYARREYVTKFSNFLSEVLALNPTEVEDTIHGKTALFPSTSFVIKEDLTEDLYFKLKSEEKNWPGLLTQETPKRVYPNGKTACDLIGYVGAISSKQYVNIADEIATLQKFLQEANKGAILPRGFSSKEQVQIRLNELQEKNYSLNDQVGKSGVELAFDEKLRGSYGKKMYEVDIKGNFLRPLPGGKEPEQGERVVLSISLELQKEAEKMLAEFEALQDKRDNSKNKDRSPPFQRGGAIVAMHPKTGEILALASTPRFDPNDLIPAKALEKRKEKQDSIIRSLESESYIGQIWDGKRPLERERYENGYFTEEEFLTWEGYLDRILPKTGTLRELVTRANTIEKALEERDLSCLSYQRDQDLYCDLMNMVVRKEDFSPSLLQSVCKQTLSKHREYSQLAAKYTSEIKKIVREQFKKSDFQHWREKNFKKHLLKIRKQERDRGRYARPYTDYLLIEEERQFDAFWKKNRFDFIYTFLLQTKAKNNAYFKKIKFLRNQIDDPKLLDLKTLLIPLLKQDRIAYLKSLRSFEDLKKPLIGKYPSLRSENNVQLEKHLAAAFYPYGGFGFGRSQAYRQATPMGSVFKVIPALTALSEKGLDPLTLTDDMKNKTLGKFENGETINRRYKGGNLPRGFPNMGKLDIIKALERSSNVYFSILAGDILKSPTSLLNAAKNFGLGKKTGIDLPDEYQGQLPDDALYNKTGLYAFAIGQHSLVATPLQTACLFSALANGGDLLKPQIVKLSAGKKSNTDLFSAKHYPKKSALELLGIYFPLFTGAITQEKEGFISFNEPQIRGHIEIKPEIQKTLFDGMSQVVNGSRGTARLEMMQPAFHNPEWLKSFRKVKSRMIGKTGTAEIMYKPTIDAETEAKLEKHVCFSGIGFKDDKLNDPEIVVVVYLRFGSAGRQGAPMAAHLMEKWREIEKRHAMRVD